MANIVTVKKRSPDKTNRYIAVNQWTFTDDLIAGIHAPTGIAWDGEQVWLCSHSTVPRQSRLIGFDPVQGVQSVKSFAIGISTLEAALDIVWNQLYDDRWGMYLLTIRPGDPNIYKLYLIDRDGGATFLISLLVDFQHISYRAVAFDGRFIYVTFNFSPAGAGPIAVRLSKIDVLHHVGLAVAEIFVPNTGDLGEWGVVYDGFRWHMQAQIFGFVFYAGYIRSEAAVDNLSKFVQSPILGPIGGDAFIGPCTYDRKHIYDFEVVSP